MAEADAVTVMLAGALSIGRDDGTTANAIAYVQSGQLTIADYTVGAGATSPTYTYAIYTDEPVVLACSSGLRYYHRGQQYSVTALTDSSGTIVERYAYDAYGGMSVFNAAGTARTSTTEGNRYTCTGREYDDVLDLYHYRGRMFNSIVGRFCSRDPIGFKGSEWNLYEYVASNPPTYTDGLGLFPVHPDGTPIFSRPPKPVIVIQPSCWLIGDAGNTMRELETRRCIIWCGVPHVSCGRIFMRQVPCGIGSKSRINNMTCKKFGLIRLKRTLFDVERRERV